MKEREILIEKGTKIRVISEGESIDLKLSEDFSILQEEDGEVTGIEREIDEVTFYSRVAPVLIDGETDGIPDDIGELAMRFLDWIKGEYGASARIIGIEEETYTGSLPDFYPEDLNVGEGELIDYTVEYIAD